jgi:hypothetical protein
MAEIIIIALLAVQIIMVVLNYRERKDLLDRIMAKSFVEYKDNDKLEENDFGKDDPNIINLDEAKEEING